MSKEREPNLTPRWNCFFDLLFIAFVLVIQNTEKYASENPAPANLKHLCSEPCPPEDGRNGEINTSPA